MKLFLVFFLIFLFSCFHSNKDNNDRNLITGRVVAVIDGDTYDVLVDGIKKIRVRMEGIDAPEKGMPFYRASKNYLSQLCFNKYVRLKEGNVDFHNRIISYTYLDDGRELSHEMVRAGLAWHFTKYSSDSLLAELEAQAKLQKLGLWVDKNPMPPWQNRRLHREGISTKDSFLTKPNEF